MSTYGQRLAEALKESKKSRKNLADALGISVQAVGDAIRGKTAAFTAENNSKAAVFLGIDSDQLATGRPAIAKTGHTNTSPGPAFRGKVPLISWVQAGAWCQASDPEPPGAAERWLDCPVSHGSNSFALRVRGDSMTAPHGNTRTYPEGCIIFVDPERRAPNNGDRVVACLSGTDEVTFKVYKNEDGRQWLQPLNPTHEPIREKFSILGTVLGKWEDG